MAKAIDVSGHFPTSGHSLSAHDELRLLIKECIALSRPSQKKLYEKYSPAAYGIIRKYVSNDEATAKEILNDAFFKVFRDLHQYSFQGAFEGWIRRIVVHAISDHMRKNVKPDKNFREVKAEDAYVNSEPVENLSHKELLTIIETLPDAQRNVFNLFVFENYSHKEIAKMLNMQQNNCRWHLNDARRRLKEKINALINK
ncbi:sigma-70 family RNA polymerase sigma factor [Nemorincola caseinilytica]|uniref:RNA polymerase sigma factor n=1 Tax=Nemorincola caseinilytica TaxID=2054315 RepID=UPI0031F0FFBB